MAMMNAFDRRALLGRGAAGMGAVALSSLLSGDLRGAIQKNPMAPRQSHYPAKAKSIIHIHMVGAPSHLDLFDDKPELRARTGEKCPEEFFQGKRLAFIREHPQLLGTPDRGPFAFRSCGQSGLRLSNLLPHLQGVADELCMIKTVHTDQFNHGPAQLMMLTGFNRFGRPSIGSWVTYGLGTENRDLPGFVVMVTGQYLGAGKSAFGAGFLPSVYQGVEFRSAGDPVLFLSDPEGLSRADRGRSIDRINALNQLAYDEVGDPEIATRINQYEMAYRMQASVPDLMEIKDESQATHAMYGTKPGAVSFANNCLLARRMVERGVRFVQLFDQGWDHHNSVFSSLPKKAEQVDRPIAALIRDLKQRGLLESTLVVWSAEFGRTPMAQGNNSEGESQKIGRDHHKEAFTLWMAGGGVKGGHVHGRTDPLGYAPIQDSVHVHDFNATILHLMGMNHEQLTFRFQGRDYRLTDIEGELIHGILA